MTSRITAPLVQRLLENEGFDVDVAYDGRECLEKVRAQPPDAIVLDIVMPEKDGRAVCREIKDSPRYRHIPILILSAACSHVTSTRYSRYKAMYADADAYLPKPAQAEEIVSSLKRLL